MDEEKPLSEMEKIKIIMTNMHFDCSHYFKHIQLNLETTLECIETMMQILKFEPIPNNIEELEIKYGRKDDNRP